MGQKNKFLTYLDNTVSDWLAWGNKLKWNLVSFKFLSFFGFITLIVFFWYGLHEALDYIVQSVRDLQSKDQISKESVEKIIVTSITVLYDKTFGHLSIMSAGILIAIIGLKAVAERTDASILKNNEDKLKEFLSKKASEQVKNK